MGSTFALELPIYNRNVAGIRQTAAEIEDNAAVSTPPTLQPRSHIRPTTIVRVVPYDRAPEVMIEHRLEGVSESLTILVVDDSSANRSVRVWMDCKALSR